MIWVCTLNSLQLRCGRSVFLKVNLYGHFINRRNKRSGSLRIGQDPDDCYNSDVAYMRFRRTRPMKAR